MALKALLLGKDLGQKRKALAELETRSADFEKRTADLTAAIEEMTEETTQEQRDAVSEEIDNLETEKAEHDTKVSQLREEIAALEKELDEAEKEQEVPADNKPEERTDNTMTMAEIRSNQRYIDAYADYIREKIDDAQLRAVVTDLAGDNIPTGSAGIPVPTFVSEIIETAWKDDEIMQLVRKANFKGIFKQGFEISATPAGYHTEGGAEVQEETLLHGIVTLSPQMIKKWVSVSKEVLATRDSEEFLRYIYDELTYQIVKFAASQVLAAIAAAPVTSTTSAVGLPKVTASALALGDIYDGLGELSGSARNLAVALNRKTWAAYKKAELAAEYPVNIFEGMRVVFDDSIPAFSAATTGQTFMILGDFDGVLVNRPNGDDVEIVVDPYSAKKKDLVEVLGEQYIAIGVTRPGSLVRFVKG